MDNRRRLLEQHAQLRGAAGAAPALDAQALLSTLHNLEALATEGQTWDELVLAAARQVVATSLSMQCLDGLNITCDKDLIFDRHLPLADEDGDFHADHSSEFLRDHLRGASWRGRDCNDKLADVRPGVAVSSHGADVDANCNGVVGTDAASGKSYEELFCSGENAPMGVAVLGDSASAHFHLPASLLNAKTFTLHGALPLVANEADWPQCSWATGHRDPADCPSAKALGAVPTKSIYTRLLELNRCNHRDFANIAVNGARVGAMAPPGIINGLSRRQATDAPMLVFFALIGNDVCNGHAGFDHMTKEDEFQRDVLASLAYLDATLPAGSHVAFLGLVDGRVLYESTSTETHPLGLSYPEVYDALNCNQCNPCWGWLNSNATVRDMTSARAAQLTAVYDKIIAANASEFKNFDMYRIQMDWPTLIAKYVAAGGKAADVIEPIDGFHPSQTGHYLLADVMWNDLLANRPHWIPKPNPNNAAIQKLFGDQGGY